MCWNVCYRLCNVYNAQNSILNISVSVAEMIFSPGKSKWERMMSCDPDWSHSYGKIKQRNVIQTLRRFSCLSDWRSHFKFSKSEENRKLKAPWLISAVKITAILSEKRIKWRNFLSWIRELSGLKLRGWMYTVRMETPKSPGCFPYSWIGLTKH